MNKYVLIPGLLMVESDLKKFAGFYFGHNLNFFRYDTGCKYKFQVRKLEHFVFPEKPEYIDTYTKYKKPYWYYERKLFLNMKLRFLYNEETREIFYNNFLRCVPFQIGNIRPLGELISDVIRFEMEKNGYDSFHGAAFYYNNQTCLIFAPGYTGKSFLIAYILELGGRYISEDVVVVKDNTIYLTAVNYFEKRGNKEIRNIKHATKRTINKIFLLYRSNNNLTQKISYQRLNSLLGYYGDNRRGILYETLKHKYLLDNYNLNHGDEYFLSDNIDINLVYFNDYNYLYRKVLNL